MGDSKEFIKAKDLGDIGEKYFNTFAYYVTGEFTINLGSPEQIEGWDNGRLFICLNSNTGELKKIEVKTIKNFLGRDNDGDEPTGTIPIELWNTGMNFYGWLYGMVHSAEYNIMQAERNCPLAVKPDLLVYALADQNSKVFSFICFDFEELIDRLEEIETRWSIKEWSLPMVKDQELDGVVNNVWQVPFQKIQDLARVTMINYEDRKEDWQDNKELQGIRLDNLVNLAKNGNGGGCRYGKVLEHGSYIENLEELMDGRTIKVYGSEIEISYTEEDFCRKDF